MHPLPYVAGDVVVPKIVTEACYLINQRRSIEAEAALPESVGAGDLVLGERAAESRWHVIAHEVLAAGERVVLCD